MSNNVWATSAGTKLINFIGALALLVILYFFGRFALG